MTTQNPSQGLTCHDALAFTPVRTKRAGFLDLFRVLWNWHERSRMRHHFASLDDHLLRDIGLTRTQVRELTSKPYMWL